MTTNTLALINIHERDNNIKFYENGHKYEILTDKESKYTSVTTWTKSHFGKFYADSIIRNIMKGKDWKEGHKYWGLTAEEIKKSWNDNGAAESAEGTRLHFEIECFMNNEKIQKDDTHNEILELNKNLTNQSLEWSYFLKFIEDHPYLKPFRTEWMVYDEDIKIAGSIDMVYENKDGTLSIYDWKRSKEISKKGYNKFAKTSCISHLPDSNFWHYAIQLNTYKMILENKYNKIVKELFLVRLHPNNDEKTYDLISIPLLKAEMEKLVDVRKSSL
jgi:hypothetical protein